MPDDELAEMRTTLEAEAVNPMELKKRLARDLVTQFHDPQTSHCGPKATSKARTSVAMAPEEAQVISLPEWVEKLREEAG